MSNEEIAAWVRYDGRVEHVGTVRMRDGQVPTRTRLRLYVDDERNTHLTLTDETPRSGAGVVYEVTPEDGTPTEPITTRTDWRDARGSRPRR